MTDDVDEAFGVDPVTERHIDPQRSLDLVVNDFQKELTRVDKDIATCILANNMTEAVELEVKRNTLLAAISQFPDHVVGVRLDDRRAERGEFNQRTRFRGYCSCGWISARTLSEEDALGWAQAHAEYIGGNGK